MGDWRRAEINTWWRNKRISRMMEESRDKTLNKLIDHAKSMGANGLIAVRYDSEQ